MSKKHIRPRREADEKLNNVAKAKKRSRKEGGCDCDMDINITAGLEKRYRKEGESKNCESSTDISDDSAYTSFDAPPSTPFDSVQLPSVLDSCQGHSVESSCTSTNLMHDYNFADSDTSTVEEPMDFVVPEHFSTPNVSARRQRIVYYQKNYRVLKEHIEPLNKILDQLISQGCRDSLLSEKIREAQGRERRADILVKYAAKHLNQRSFEDLLRITDYGHLIDCMNQGTVPVHVNPEDEDTGNLLSDTQFQNFLRSEIEPLLFIDKLLELQVLSFNDHDDLLKTSFRPERVNNLLKYFENRPKIHRQYLFVILKQEYPDLIDEFLKDKAGSSQDIRPDFEMKITAGAWRLGQESKWDQYAKVQLHMKMSPSSPDVEMKVIERSEETNMEVEYNQKLLDLQQENIGLGSIVIVHRQLSTLSIKKLRKACSNGEITKYIRSLFTASDIEQMRRDGVTAFVLSITAEQFKEAEDNNTHLKITKEAMVRHFSFIEKEIIDALKFLPGFLKSGILNAENEKILKELYDKPIAERNVEFLNFIIRGQSGLLQIFQNELARHGFLHILKKLCFDDAVPTCRNITGKELMQNVSFLLTELEPKEFLPAFENTIPEDVMNDIVCNKSRRERARLFLDEVVKRGQQAIHIFVSELERLDRKYILDILQASNSIHSGIGTWDAFQIRVCILDNYETFIDELEPKMFRTFFLEKVEIEKEKLEAIIKLPSRRKRAVYFLKWLLEEGTSKALIDFRHAAKTICSRAIVKIFESPESLSIFEWLPPVVDDEDDVVCTSVLLYSATFEVTFYYDLTSPDPIMQERQSHESNTVEKYMKSLEKETCTHVCVPNSNGNEEDKKSSSTDSLPDFKCNELSQSTITTDSVPTTSYKNSFQRGKSRKRDSDNMMSVPNKRVFIDHKVTKWLMKHVMDNSNASTPLSTDLQAVQVKPLSNSTTSSTCEISGSIELDSATTPWSLQDGNLQNGNETNHNKSTSILRKDSTTDISAHVYESTNNPSASADDNISISDQGYMSYQDCDQMSSYTSGGFNTGSLKTAESSFHTNEDAQNCSSNSPALNSRSFFRKPVPSPPVIQTKRGMIDKYINSKSDIAKSPMSFSTLSPASATFSSQIGSPSIILFNRQIDSSSPTYDPSRVSLSPNPSLSSSVSSPVCSTVIMSQNLAVATTATKERLVESRVSYGSPCSDEVSTHINSAGCYRWNIPKCSSPIFYYTSSPPEQSPSSSLDNLHQ